MQERNTSNQVTAQLVRDGNIGGILSRTTAQGAAFYGYDGNGNVTLLTNAAGQDVGHYRYDAFGNTLEVQGARAGENPYRFSTKELHGPSGLYDYGFRFYSPGMGRWLNRDPLGEGGGVNLYGMVGNNPVNDVDAYGLVRWKDVTDAVDKWVKDVLEPPKAQPIDGDPVEAQAAEKTSINRRIGNISKYSDTPARVGAPVGAQGLIGVSKKPLENALAQLRGLSIGGNKVVSNVYAFGSRAGSMQKGLPHAKSDLDLLVHLVGPQLNASQQRRYRREIDKISQEFASATGFPLQVQTSRFPSTYFYELEKQGGGSGKYFKLR